MCMCIAPLPLPLPLDPSRLPPAHQHRLLPVGLSFIRAITLRSFNANRPFPALPVALQAARSNLVHYVLYYQIFSDLRLLRLH